MGIYQGQIMEDIQQDTANTYHGKACKHCRGTERYKSFRGCKACYMKKFKALSRERDLAESEFREFAREQQESKFYDGKLCDKHKTTLRYLSNDTCVECGKEHRKNAKEKALEPVKNKQDTVNPRARARFTRRRSKTNTYSLPDFQRMIWDLKRLNWSHDKIAYQIGVQQASTVSAWATGTRPFYDHGEQLIEFWKEQTHLHHVPRVNERFTLKYKVGQIEMNFDADKL